MEATYSVGYCQSLKNVWNEVFYFLQQRLWIKRIMASYMQKYPKFKWIFNMKTLIHGYHFGSVNDNRKSLLTPS